MIPEQPQSSRCATRLWPRRRRRRSRTKEIQHAHTHTHSYERTFMCTYNHFTISMAYEESSRASGKARPTRQSVHAIDDVAIDGAGAHHEDPPKAAPAPADLRNTWYPR